MSDLLLAVALVAAAFGWTLYALFVRGGVWRTVFGESIALMAAGAALAVAGLAMEPAPRAWITLALTGGSLGAFLAHTLVVLHNPATLRLRVGDPVPVFRLPDQEGRPLTFDDLTGPWGLYLVVGRGARSASCVAELVQLRDAADRFGRRGLSLAALTADGAPTVRDLARRRGLSFPVLSDPGLVVIDRLGLRHPGGRAGRDIARPASILFDGTGLVRWTFQGGTIHVRASVEEVLAVADARLAAAAGRA